MNRIGAAGASGAAGAIDGVAAVAAVGCECIDVEELPLLPKLPKLPKLPTLPTLRRLSILTLLVLAWEQRKGGEPPLEDGERCRWGWLVTKGLVRDGVVMRIVSKTRAGVGLSSVRIGLAFVDCAVTPRP